MDPKQKMTLAVFGGISGIVILALLALLVMKIGDMSAARDARDEAEQTLESHYGADPYPSDANRKIREADAAAFAAWSDEARAQLTHGLTVPEGESPSQFVSRIGETIRALNDRQKETAQRLAVRTAAKNAASPETGINYSFGRYVEQGEMPDADKVPRLAQQFAVAEAVSTLLLDQGANSITEFTRTLFDAATEKKAEEETRSSRRRRSSRARNEEPVAADGATQVDPLLAKDGVTCESYSVKFRARYNTLANVLNELTKGKLFVVVTDVQIANTVSVRDRVAEMVKKRESARTAAARRARRDADAASPAAEADRPLFEGASPADRLVTDPEHAMPLDILIKFDVYSAPAPEAEAAPAEGADEKEGN